MVGPAICGYRSGMLEGSCACGRIRYEIRGELLGPVTYCHCWRCRKHSGASFGTTSGVKASELRIMAGEALLSSNLIGNSGHLSNKG